MKKLKFMLAAATAIGLASASQAASYPGSTDFENFTVGAEVNSTLNQYFDFTGTVGDNESVIAETETYTPTSPVLYYRNSAHAKHLKVSTGTDPLLRKVNAATEGADVTENDVYIDTLVQFTVTPSNDTVTAGAADKLMIYLKENVLDAQTTETNLMVKAAYYVPGDPVLMEEETLEPRDVKVGTAIPGAWYRLTVKASVIKDTNQDDLLVFKIWLDGDPLANPSSTGALYGSDLTLFPSLLGKKASSDTVSTKTSLAAVGFAGEGCVDDIAFTTDDPFATAIDFTVTLGENVSAVAFTIDGADYSAGQTGTYPVYPSSTITIGQIEYAEGYMAGTTTPTDLTLEEGVYTVSGDAPAVAITAAALPTVTADGTATYSYANGVYTFTVPAGYKMVLTVDGTPVVVPAGTTTYTWDAVSGSTVSVAAELLVAQIGQNYYETFALALAAAADGDTITLRGNVTEPKFTIPVHKFYDQGLTIDLGGYTYTFTAETGSNDAIYLLSTNKLTIANGTFATQANAAFRDLIRDYDSDLTLTNVTIDAANFPAKDGSKLACLLCIEGGDVNLLGSTSIANVNAGSYAIKMGNHANAVYEMGTLTVDTTGDIEGNVLIAGGVYNEVAVGSGSTISYYYGKNVHSTWEDGVSSANFAARLGTLPTAAGTQDNVSGQLFKTLQAAVDAAQAGDTVTVVADNTISTSLSIAKNLTVHNDFTITGAVNYAICIGATVSFEGSGKIERASNISGSAFCVGANETTRGAITEGTSGTLNFDGLTVCGGNGGNLIKLEYGTVNMNGGVLRDGKRGIKADADKGRYTSAIVINGGTITNNTDCAVMASAESANGTATVTINGGVIAGALTIDKTVGTYSITIPGTSTAKFNADQSAFCADGYETTLDNGWYVVTAKQQTGWVDDSSTITAGTTAAAQYPALADTALAEADAKALTDWAKANSVAFIDATADAASYVEAYLLNCAPVAATVEAEKAAFKANITVNADGSITVTPPTGKTYNGTLQLKGATSLTAPITWTDVEAASSSYQFYKYELSL